MNLVAVIRLSIIIINLVAHNRKVTSAVRERMNIDTATSIFIVIMLNLMCHGVMRESELLLVPIILMWSCYTYVKNLAKFIEIWTV